MVARSRPCKNCGRQRAERFFVSSKGRVCADCRKQTAQRAHRKQRLAEYGLSPEEYDALLAYQGGACGACGQTRSYNLHVEHDHRVEREQGMRASIRGLTCARCNSLLRKARDDASLLRALAWYLDDPPAQIARQRGVIA